MPKSQDTIIFTRKDGDEVLACVTHVWDRHPSDNRPPLVNIVERETAIAYTSVPHKTDVVGATGFFYK